MTEIAKKLELSLAEKQHERNELAEKLNSATFQQAENITAVIEVNFDFYFLYYVISLSNIKSFNVEFYMMMTWNPLWFCVE